MIPAARLYVLLLVGGAIAIAVAALWPTDARMIWAFVVLLAYDLGVILLAVADSLWGGAHRVQVTRHPLQRLSIGRENRVSLSVRSGAKPAEIQIYDAYPDLFRLSEMPLHVKLPPHTTQEVTYTIHPDQRGEFAWGEIQVRQLSPGKLAWQDWRISQPQTVAVYPDLMGLRSLSIRLALQSTGAMRQKRRLGIGTEFAELREYGMGDDTRLIDWKATARRSQPLIRVLEPEQEQTLIILLDRGRLMTAQVQGLARFDWGLNATLSLALAGLHRGDRVGVGVFDRDVQTWIPPTRGTQHLPQLIERLTPIQPVLLESDYLSAVTRLVNQQHRRALVVLITDVVDTTASGELLSALTRLRPRYLPFCVTLRDPQVDVQSQAQTEDIQATYNRAVALDLLAQRQMAFAKLKQKGVLVLDAPANQMTEHLVNEYLHIKAKSQL